MNTENGCFVRIVQKELRFDSDSLVVSVIFLSICAFGLEKTSIERCEKCNSSAGAELS